MAITLTETVGSASANTYATVAEADAYLEGRRNATAWNSETDAEVKKAALLEAQRELTTRVRDWKGERVDAVQALDWPREYVPDPDRPADEFDYYATTVVPDRVKNAQIELALEFLKAGTDDVAGQDRKQNVQRKKTDVLETEYVPQSQRRKGLKRYPRVINWMEPLREARTYAGQVRLRRS